MVTWRGALGLLAKFTSEFDGSEKFEDAVLDLPIRVLIGIEQ